MTGVLSDEQMGAVYAGEGDANWRPIELPTGAIEVPAWCLGLHVNWGYGYCNAPAVTLKVRGSAHNWPEPWYKEGAKTYISRSADGRAHVHYHDGAVSLKWAWRVFKGEGRPHSYKWHVIEQGTSGQTAEQIALAEGEKAVVAIRKLCSDYPEMARREAINEPLTAQVQQLRFTTEQAGYGGSHIELVMEDGEPLILRGPWHGGAPPGYVEVHTCNWDENSNEALRAKREGVHLRYVRRELSRPWWNRSNTYGLYVTEDVFLRVVARFAPHVGVARITKPYGERLELYRPQWGASKDAIYEQERVRSARGEPAGRWWRVRFDARGGYCGTLRRPPNGFEFAESEAEFDRCARGERRDG